MKIIGMIGVAVAISALAAVPAKAADAPTIPVEVSVPGPKGPIAGTLLDPGGTGPVIVILPGSGPTDRNGNNPMGVLAAPYRMLAEALATRGVATLRADKRGLFGSKTAIADPNRVTIAEYADDAHAWAALVAHRTGRRCVWLLGHSEGGLVALQAAQKPGGLCGIILIASPGRPLGTVMREQFAANPANAAIRPSALAMIDSLEAGRTVDPESLPPPLAQLFPARVQPFMIDLFSQNPAKLAAAVHIPMLVVQGERDIQVAVADARALAAAVPKATLVLIPKVNHVLKTVEADDRAANLATYGDSALPVSPVLVDTIAAFVTGKR